MEGWIKLHRVLIEKPIWKCSTPEQKTILITLLLMASHKPNDWEWNGKKYTIQPGQFITSLKSIAEKAGPGVSIRNVRTAIDKFEKYEFLTNKSTNKNRLITIVNWELYQSIGEELASKSASNRQATDNYQECKNDKNKDIDHFDTFWKAYPKKVGKAVAEKSFNKLKVNDQLLNDMLSAINNQRRSKQWQDKQFIPNPSTWINQRRWDDEQEDEPVIDSITMTDDGAFQF